MKNIALHLFLILFFSTYSFSQVNYNETQVPDFDLPDVLVSNTGKSIKTIDDWNSIGRPEILDMFKTYMYGDFSDDGLKVEFKVEQIDNSALCGKAIRKNISMYFINEDDTLIADLLIYLPSKSVAEPVPLFLGMNFYGNHTIHYDHEIPITKSYVGNKPEFNIFNNTATAASRGVRAYRWPVERIIERGYGLATIYYGDIDPDFDDDFKNGLHKLLKSQKEINPDSRSSISAWAFALSKAMDYFETDNQINHNQIAVIGHSRLGKTALWAGATDQRFAITISNNSGCGGAALSRRKYGETLKDINNRFPHWFCKTFHQYNEKEETLPLDQHMLIALVAPRPVYVGSAVNDKWSDPKGEYLSLYYSGTVYKLFGFTTIEQDSLPSLNNSVCIGNMGYHIRSGKHDITRFDWEKYLDFADSHFK
jgi:hypothetical protein